MDPIGNRPDMKRGPVLNKTSLMFLVISFALTYLFFGLLAIMPVSEDAPVGLVFLFLGGGAPTIVAFILVHKGDKAFRETFYRNLLRFKVKPSYYVMAALLPLAMGVGTLTVTGTVAFDSSQLWLLPLFILNGILFGGLEEVGWRGFLQEHEHAHSVLVFGVVFGVVWGLWHLPMFFVQGLAHYDYGFVPFLLQGVVYSLWVTWVYARTRSVPVAVIFHAMINGSAALGLSLNYTYSLETFLYLGGLLVITILALHSLNLNAKNV